MILSRGEQKHLESHSPRMESTLRAKLGQERQINIRTCKSVSLGQVRDLNQVFCNFIKLLPTWDCLAGGWPGNFEWWPVPHLTVCGVYFSLGE